MSDNSVQQKMTFEDRIREKLRGDIGELITKDELAAIVRRSMEELFFTPTKNPAWLRLDNWQRNSTTIPETVPSLANQLAVELLKPAVEEEVKKWVVSHEPEIMAALKSTLVDGLPVAILDGFIRAFSDIAQPSMTRLAESVRTLATKTGHPGHLV